MGPIVVHRNGVRTEHREPPLTGGQRFGGGAGHLDPVVVLQHRLRRDPSADQVEAGETRGERGARAGYHLDGRALLDDPAAFDDDHPIGEQHRIEHVVGHDQRRAPLEHPPQHPPQHGGGGDVERGHRFVEQHQGRTRRQRPRDRHPLRLTAGQLSRLAIGELGGVDLGQELLRDVSCGTRPEARRTWTERHVVAHAEVREQQRVLGQQGDASGVRGHPAVFVEQHPSVELGAPGVGTQQPGDQAEHGRLARTVRAEHRDVFAWGQGDFDIEPAGGERRPHRQRTGHRSPRPCASETTNTATTTSTNDSATAASASVSRCR